MTVEKTLLVLQKKTCVLRKKSPKTFPRKTPKMAGQTGPIMDRWSILKNMIFITSVTSMKCTNQALGIRVMEMKIEIMEMEMI